MSAFKIWALLSWQGSAMLLLLGLLGPIFTFQKFYIFDDTFSLIGSAWHMLTEGDAALGVIILLFSVGFPVAKLAVQLRLIWAPNGEGHYWLKALALTGKWSMLDVFVVAILLSTIKLGAIAKIEVHYGLYCFAGAVLLSMLTTHLMKRIPHLKPRL